MNSISLSRALVLILLISSSLAASSKEPGAPQLQAAAASGRPEYPSFKIISDRNIFNANRSAGGQGGGEERKVSKVETLTLVGTLSYDKGPYAFFDGSSADYKKVLEPGKTIAGYKIADVNGTSVKLESGTNTIELRVGMKMRREDEADWKVVPGEGPALASSSSTASDSSADSASGDESAIIKRLMQQREQELK